MEENKCCKTCIFFAELKDFGNEKWLLKDVCTFHYDNNAIGYCVLLDNTSVYYCENYIKRGEEA